MAGLEPADLGVKVLCLNQRGYTPIKQEPSFKTKDDSRNQLYASTAAISVPQESPVKDICILLPTAPDSSILKVLR